MPGAHINLEFGPDTFEVSAPVTGGQLVAVDPDNPGKIRPASANSPILGVALTDSMPVPTGADGQPLVVTGQAMPHVAVAYKPTDVTVRYAGPASLGDPLASAGQGQVARWEPPPVGEPDDAHLIVGICTSPTVETGAMGRMRLTT